jgi:hypothetical protein
LDTYISMECGVACGAKSGYQRRHMFEDYMVKVLTILILMVNTMGGTYMISKEERGSLLHQ